ncbi:hypothetical protein C7999DRAFT_44594 [Corynascus novoguineensis]|uniref:Uncharacterized protein n=1 Tax=Corynascus novoguineensis TaxID=1126955 RepID=A0AAN7CKA6_9PEZI|nr:hypothetical protein C7999DRAFT_44594 [Corynascus novoguineensis]
MAQEPLHLGTLSPELFDKIFFELGTIRDLTSFVVTARFVYHRFKLQRRTILYRVLQNELGPALPDARFLFVFPYSDPADEVRYYDWIHIMAGVYREMLCGKGDPGPPTLKELTELCRTLHRINFITDIYATAQLGWFVRRRVMRAFYLRQIVSNAWASTRPTSREHGKSLGLFSAFEPWDLQHIDHVNVFTMRLCRALVCHAPEVVGEGAREISPRQFGDLYAHLDHLVRYLRAHPGVAKAAVGDVQSETTTVLGMTPAKSHLAGRMRWGGRYTHWYGSGLTTIPWLPPWESREKDWAIPLFLAAGGTVASRSGTGNGSRR